MSRWYRLALVIGAVAASLYACGPQPTQSADLIIAATPKSIADTGDLVALRVLATDEFGKPGVGSVKITSGAGSLTAGEVANLVNGAAEFSFTCKLAEDPNCAGTVRLTAKWAGKTPVETSIGILVNHVVPDAGPPDAGPPDAGPPPVYAIAVVADKTKLVMGVGDSAEVAATLLLNGQPASGENVEFSTTLGAFVQDGGVLSTTTTGVTDGTGQVKARFTDTSTSGPATIKATHTASRVSGTTSVELLSVAKVEWFSSTCKGATGCKVIGVHGSTGNDQATVRFRVTDSQGAGVVGVPVSFDWDTAPPANSWSFLATSGITLADGYVDAVVNSGTVLGAFQVRATFGKTTTSNGITAISPVIGVRGVKPANLNMTLSCTPKNLNGLQNANAKTTCTVSVADRFGNAVGGVPIQVATEGGQFLPSGNIFTDAYPAATEGKATFTVDFSNRVINIVNVAPLPADPAQYPQPREAEPQVQVGSVVRNPRDGLVTIVVSTNGEEWFDDQNHNGVQDGTEQYLHMPRAFVDANDNNVMDSNEFAIDSQPDDGGVAWQGQTTVWTSFHLLVTDMGDWTAAKVVASDGGVMFGPGVTTVPFNIARGATEIFDLYLPDKNLNRLVPPASFTVTHSATKGAVALKPDSPLTQDTRGFDLEVVQTNLAGTGPCTTVCTLRTVFYKWTEGKVGPLTLTGAPVGDVTAAQSDGVTMSSTVEGATNPATWPGTMQ